MSDLELPSFDALSHDAAMALLERNGLGRVAFSLHDRIDIEPISYVSNGGWVYIRTSPGTKVSTVQHHPWVAFEVDEVEGRYDWQSVVVRGSIHILQPGTSHSEQLAFNAALAAIRTRDPNAMQEGDRTPQRTLVMRIHVAEITGRVAHVRNG
jgi:nitroimidazol reductase NimA-like FMN-containing flavoprotein (pyridoxamine 5'-phosphate oxidase superfamily)